MVAEDTRGGVSVEKAGGGWLGTAGWQVFDVLICPSMSMNGFIIHRLCGVVCAFVF